PLDFDARPNASPEDSRGRPGVASVPRLLGLLLHDLRRRAPGRGAAVGRAHDRRRRGPWRRRLALLRRQPLADAVAPVVLRSPFRRGPGVRGGLDPRDLRSGRDRPGGQPLPNARDFPDPRLAFPHGGLALRRRRRGLLRNPDAAARGGERAAGPPGGGGGPRRGARGAAGPGGPPRPLSAAAPPRAASAAQARAGA